MMLLLDRHHAAYSATLLFDAARVERTVERERTGGGGLHLQAAVASDQL